MKIEYEMKRQTESVSNRVWFDIETAKVDAPLTWGFKRRWMVFMVSYAMFEAGEMILRCVSGTEAELIDHLSEVFHDRVAVYGARFRDFDRYVLEGRFTHARAALSPRPGDWPHLQPGTSWLNVKNATLKERFRELRAADIASAEIPEVWKYSSYRDVIVIHCVRDVIELMIMDDACDLDDACFDTIVGYYKGYVI